MFSRPTTDIKKPFKGLVFDSTYEKFKGAVTNVSVKDGVVKKGLCVIIYKNYIL